MTYLLKPLLGKNFGGVAWTPFVMQWSFYSTVLPGDMHLRRPRLLHRGSNGTHGMIIIETVLD